MSDRRSGKGRAVVVTLTMWGQIVLPGFEKLIGLDVMKMEVASG